MSKEFKAKVVFDDGFSVDLPDMTYDAFVKHAFKEGISDVAYSEYLMKNKMKEIHDFNESILESKIYMENSAGRLLVFKCVFDSDHIPEGGLITGSKIMSNNEGGEAVIPLSKLESFFEQGLDSPK